MSNNTEIGKKDLDDKDMEIPKYFHSRRIKKEEIRKPWLMAPPDPRDKWRTILPFIGAFMGFCLGALLLWDGWRTGYSHKYCKMFEDTFEGGINTEIWSPEITTGGFGPGSFDMTTGDAANLFVDDNGHLNIMPVLQEESLITTVGSKIDLGADCTATNRFYCKAQTFKNGTIVPPVRSARITTKKFRGGSITYGRVQITAKMPVGDWLWPAIWMMPLADTYGEWPRSGEIDIAESRGNNHTYPDGGNSIFSSALHWGPDYASDAWYRTYDTHKLRHSTFADGFNNFGLEWSQKYLFTFVNNRLQQVLYTPFLNPLWGEGNFKDKTDKNGTGLTNPWNKGALNAPFDQPFYLILNVAVGGTNAWFKDGVAGKPWADQSPTAAKDFWDARDEWLPTWTQPAMQIKHVTMWQQCDGDEQDWGVKDGVVDEATGDIPEGAVRDQKRKYRKRSSPSALQALKHMAMGWVA